jgi:hypothetical protein
MTETLDSVMRRVLNDPDIFSSPYDQKMRAPIPLLFQKEDWKQLRNAFEKGDKSFFDSQVDNRLKNLRQEAQKSQDWRKGQIKKLISLGESLRKAYETKPNLLRQLFGMFDSFGLVVCNLPNMEDYGKVIENYTRPIVEQFFLYKIDKAPWKEKRALKKTLEYVKELYSMNLDLLEIAFFVRKLNSLIEFVEVIKNE